MTPEKATFFEVIMTLIDMKIWISRENVLIIPPAGVHLGPEKHHLFCSVPQMITTQKQLIENADAVQEKIAQVQREGTLFVCLTGALCEQRLCLLIGICVGLFNISKTCFAPGANMKLFNK